MARKAKKLAKKPPAKKKKRKPPIDWKAIYEDLKFSTTKQIRGLQTDLEAVRRVNGGLANELTKAQQKLAIQADFQREFHAMKSQWSAVFVELQAYKAKFGTHQNIMGEYASNAKI